ncbi:acyltransferase [Duganella phyllosphaerae]|uniref:Putative acetyltransferase n=1 Tax=Duganella phyllosphaerae TaxID=762836 RepID=A0A1E7WHR5_9BURK|nr:acyltransferase [Duganella phyllosphaerae]OEZ98112.1 putative acetyltransferase [Duganella phyllosphaerae]
MRILIKIKNKSLYDIFNSIGSYLVRLKARFFYGLFFGSMGKKSAIYKPLFISHPQHIFVKDFVSIRNGVRLEVITGHSKSVPRLTIGHNVNIEQNVHIICGSRVTIGDNVSITGGVAIVDVNHPHEDVDDKSKIGSRIQCDGNYVEIGDNVFIGFGAIIMPNVKIGRNSVIGAHSVVNHDIPEFSVAAGTPAKVLKKYCFELKDWKKL